MTRSGVALALATTTLAACRAPAPEPGAVFVQPPEPEVRASETLYGRVIFLSDDLSVWSRIHDHSEVALVVCTHEREGRELVDDVLPRIRAEMRVLDVVARQSNEIYVLGRDGSSRTVVERWTLAEPAGTPFLHFARASTHRGTAVPWRPDAQIRQGISDEPPGPRLCTREEVLRTAIGAEPVWMQVDVDGRYVLVGTREPALVVQLWIDGSGQRVDLCSESDAPGLGRIASLDLAQHVEHGRVLLLRLPDEARTRCVLTDPDNDGVFSAPWLIPEERWEADGWNSAVWYRPSLSDWTVDVPEE